MLYCVCCVCRCCMRFLHCCKCLLGCLRLKKSSATPTTPASRRAVGQLLGKGGRSGGKEANADLLLAIINHELRIPSVYNYRCRSQFQHVFPLPLPTPLADKGKQNEAEQRKNKKEKYSNSFSLVLGSDCFSGQGQDAATAAAAGSNGSEGVFPPCKLKIIFHLVFMAIFEMFYRPVSGRERRESEVRGQLKLWKWPQNMLERKCFK